MGWRKEMLVAACFAAIAVVGGCSSDELPGDDVEVIDFGDGKTDSLRGLVKHGPFPVDEGLDLRVSSGERYHLFTLTFAKPGSIRITASSPGTLRPRILSFMERHDGQIGEPDEDIVGGPGVAVLEREVGRGSLRILVTTASTRASGAIRVDVSCGEGACTQGNLPTVTQSIFGRGVADLDTSGRFVLTRTSEVQGVEAWDRLSPNDALRVATILGEPPAPDAYLLEMRHYYDAFEARRYELYLLSRGGRRPTTGAIFRDDRSGRVEALVDESGTFTSLGESVITVRPDETCEGFAETIPGMLLAKVDGRASADTFYAEGSFAGADNLAFAYECCASEEGGPLSYCDTIRGARELVVREVPRPEGVWEGSMFDLEGLHLLTITRDGSDAVWSHDHFRRIMFEARRTDTDHLYGISRSMDLTFAVTSNVWADIEAQLMDRWATEELSALGGWFTEGPESPLVFRVEAGRDDSLRDFGAGDGQALLLMVRPDGSQAFVTALHPIQGS